jgi:hypothetical protein
LIRRPLQNVVAVDRDASRRTLACDLWWLVWHMYELYPRLQYGCSKTPRIATETSLCAVGLCCKTVDFRSGPEGTRTPDLRHARAARRFSKGFWSLQNSCKSPYFSFGAFPNLSGYLLGLLHGCCTLAAIESCLGIVRICKANRHYSGHRGRLQISWCVACVHPGCYDSPSR